ncbi:ParA/MinD ATPase like-domain-containing protein, partial [Piptocephalis cylindrospora]
QLIYGVRWEPLDVLFLDMPPGTGDLHLSLCQQIGLDGAVVVTTPQDVALEDVRRGIGMYEKFGIHIYGVVENMSYFHCPNCQHHSHIFGSGGGDRLAKEYGIPMLGAVPLAEQVRSSSDQGTP